MITKEEFTDLILEHKNWDNKLYDVEKILGICPLEIDWIEYCSRLFDKTLYFLFKKEAVDNILWWLWEKPSNPELKIFDKDGKEIPTETIDDLWELVKDYRK